VGKCRSRRRIAASANHSAFPAARTIRVHVRFTRASTRALRANQRRLSLRERSVFRGAKNDSSSLSLTVIEVVGGAVLRLTPFVDGGVEHL
jgi:hypothetical protein